MSSQDMRQVHQCLWSLLAGGELLKLLGRPRPTASLHAPQSTQTA